MVTEPERLIDYSHDEGPEEPCLPDVLVRVLGVDEVAGVIEAARTEGVPVTPRGLGTGLAGGSVPVQGGIVLSLELMNRILEVDQDNLMVRTQPGVITGNLQKACLEYNLYYPVDPASLDDCSIGGNVATNAGGARAFKYGVTGDYVTGLEAVLANGKVIRYGGKLRKNVTGYDLNRIFIGAEGTLGVVTEIVLRLVPKPRYQVDLLVPFAELSQGVALVLGLVHQQRIVPAVVEFIERKGVAACNRVLDENLPFGDAGVQVLVEVEGNERDRVIDEALAVAEMANGFGAGEPLIAAEANAQARLWTARRSLAKTLKKIYPEVHAEDIVVPLARLPETVSFIAELERRFSLVIVPFGHIGDGNIHVDFCREEEGPGTWRQRCARAIDELIDFVVGVGGQITAEHGVGSLKRRFLRKGLGDEEIAVMRQLKKSLDPDGILNPGKVLP